MKHISEVKKKNVLSYIPGVSGMRPSKEKLLKCLHMRSMVPYFSRIEEK